MDGYGNSFMEIKGNPPQSYAALSSSSSFIITPMAAHIKYT